MLRDWLEDDSDDLPLLGVEDTGPDIVGLDEAIVAAEAMRKLVIDSLSQNFGFQNASLSCAGVNQIAYWGWDFFVYSDDGAFAASLEMVFETGKEPAFSVKVTSPESDKEVREWSASGSSSPETIAEVLYDTFYELLGEIGDDLKVSKWDFEI